MRSSGEMSQKRVRTVRNSSDRNQKSKASDASKMRIREGCYTKWLKTCCLMPVTLFYDSVNIRFWPKLCAVMCVCVCVRLKKSHKGNHSWQVYLL